MIKETISTRNLAKGLLLTHEAIKYRANSLGIPYRQRETITKINGKNFVNFERFFYKDEVERISNYKEPYFLPDIIYVHTTWVILESKINHLTLNKL